MSLLDNIGILDLLTETEKANLALFCQEKKLKKGEVLFFEGDEANAMYLLKEGKIRISKDMSGNEIILGDVNAEEILGEMALFGDGLNRMATAKAVTDSSLITILSFSIEELTLKHPELLDKIKNIIETRKTINKITIENQLKDFNLKK